MDKKYTIYIHRNKINNKCYVGITCQTVHERWRNGDGYLTKNSKGYYNQPKIARAINKYGWDNFEHIIWAENLSHDEACHIEKLLIAIWNTIDNGYNITKGGEGTTGISRYGADNPFYGKKHNENTKKKISEANKGNQYWLGKQHSNETKQKMAAPKTEKHKQSMSENHADVAGKNNPRARKVIRLKDNKIFDYLNGAANEIGINKETLRKYCKAHNGWMYLDEYESLTIGA